MTVRPASLALAAAAGLLLAACGAGAPTSQASSEPTPAASPTTPAHTPVPTGGGTQLDRCHTAGLSISAIGPVGAAAGNLFQELGFTNETQTACWMYGYPGMAMLNAAGQQMPTNVVRDQGSRFPGIHLAQVTVRPGATAPFWVHWEDVPTGSETTCPTSASLIVTPPDETTQVHLASFMATACNHGELDVSPVAAPGTTSPS